jgi:hypothetical protein
MVEGFLLLLLRMRGCGQLAWIVPNSAGVGALSRLSGPFHGLVDQVTIGLIIRFPAM